MHSFLSKLIEDLCTLLIIIIIHKCYFCVTSLLMISFVVNILFLFLQKLKMKKVSKRMTSYLLYSQKKAGCILVNLAFDNLFYFTLKIKCAKQRQYFFIFFVFC